MSYGSKEAGAGPQDAASPVASSSHGTGQGKGRDGGDNTVGRYRRALEALRSGSHGEATAGFREFLKVFPDHDLSDNAQYWLGECAYDAKDYPTAVRDFRRVVDRYPDGNKVPDALLKVGFSLLALGSEQPGRQALEQLARSYPGHEAAALAGAKLADLRAKPAPADPAATEPAAGKPAAVGPGDRPLKSQAAPAPPPGALSASARESRQEREERTR